MVLHRNYLHLPKALEFFLIKRKSYFIVFPSNEKRKEVLRFLQKKKLNNLKVLQLSSNISTIWNELKLTEKWQNGIITNYEYLIYVNLFAGRSFNDLTQYPIFPWILNDYTSETIDINDPKNYRDLNKPIGAINETRLNNLIKISNEAFEDPKKSYLYRIHYSTSYFVSYYLLRLEPFTTINIKMQDNKFDNSQRIFSSIQKVWECVSSPVVNDFRELIPEFFTTPEFLINSNGFDLGKDINDNIINDVILPKWAKTPYEFIEIHKNALESNYVNNNLNGWIDLIFGYKQQGKAAIEANNTFPPFSYASCITKSVLNDPEMLSQCQQNAFHFGITPKQIFTSPHPKRQNVVQIHNFYNLREKVKLTQILKTQFRNIFMRNDQTNLILINIKGLLTMINYNNANNTTNNNNNNNIEEDLTRYIGSIEEFSEKKFSCLMGSNILIASSNTDSSFHLFQIENNSIKHIEMKNQFSLNIAVCQPDNYHLITASTDSSIILWHLGVPTSIVYRISPHSEPIIDVKANLQLNMIVSCDKSKTIVVSELSQGAFIRSISIPSNILKIEISTNPCILVAYEGVKDKTSLISTFNINGKKVATVEIMGKNLSWCEMKINNLKSLLAVGDQQNKLKIFELPTLKLIADIEMMSQITTMCYNTRNNKLYCACENNIVYSL